jgi:hypothetical protein
MTMMTKTATDPELAGVKFIAAQSSVPHRRVQTATAPIL